MKSAKAKILLSSILTLSAVSFTAVVGTFAWLNFNREIQPSITTDTGSIEIDSLTANAYKYDYPVYGSNTSSSSSANSVSSKEVLYNYDGDGTISATDLLASKIKMNKYDPFYISLNPDIGVNALNTNVVVCLSFNLKTSSSYALKINAIRITDANWSSSRNRISPHLNFFVSTETDYANLSTTTYNYRAADTGNITKTVTSTKSTDDPYGVIFYGMKNYEEGYDTDGTTALSPVPSASTFIVDSGQTPPSSIALYNSGDVAFVPTTVTSSASVMEKEYKIYMSIDYNEASLTSYAQSLRADQTISLGMDYFFKIQADQI